MAVAKECCADYKIGRPNAPIEY